MQHPRIVCLRAVVGLPGGQPGGVGQQVFDGDLLALVPVLGGRRQLDELRDILLTGSEMRTLPCCTNCMKTEVVPVTLVTEARS